MPMPGSRKAAAITADINDALANRDKRIKEVYEPADAEEVAPQEGEGKHEQKDGDQG
jgi:hypothetical protein